MTIEVVVQLFILVAVWINVSLGLIALYLASAFRDHVVGSFNAL